MQSRGWMAFECDVCLSGGTSFCCMRQRVKVVHRLKDEIHCIVVFACACFLERKIMMFLSLLCPVKWQHTRGGSGESFTCVATHWFRSILLATERVRSAWWPVTCIQQALSCCWEAGEAPPMPANSWICRLILLLLVYHFECPLLFVSAWNEQPSNEKPPPDHGPWVCSLRAPSFFSTVWCTFSYLGVSLRATQCAVRQLHAHSWNPWPASWTMGGSRHPFSLSECIASQGRDKTLPFSASRGGVQAIACL
jgi:hypothetical protein